MCWQCDRNRVRKSDGVIRFPITEEGLAWLAGQELYKRTEQCAEFNQLVIDGRIDPCLSQVYQFDEIGESHQAMYENRHAPGNMAILVNAPRPGMNTLP